MIKIEAVGGKVRVVASGLILVSLIAMASKQDSATLASSSKMRWEQAIYIDVAGVEGFGLNRTRYAIKLAIRWSS